MWDLFSWCSQDRKDKSSFYNVFYLVINLGSLLAVTVVVYIQDPIYWAKLILK
jgi:peptide/histidine transporter 3/4